MKVELKTYTQNAEAVISEQAGICYNSEKANIRRLKADSHFATFRFAHATFEISEFSRACSMQMLRHKFLDFLQRSQRYVNEFKFSYTTPHTVMDTQEALELYDEHMKVCQTAYDELIKLRIPKGDARYVLPNACHTKMNVTGSFQAWHDFLRGDAGRLQKAAQWEIREIAAEIDSQLHTIAPNIFEGDGPHKHSTAGSYGQI